MRYRNRRQATTYIRENGLPIGDGFLAQQAVTGEGPPFRYSGRHPIYTEEDLDVWMEARLSAPVRSPSEAAAASPSKSEEQDSKLSLGPPARAVRRQATASTTTKSPRPKPKTPIATADLFDEA